MKKTFTNKKGSINEKLKQWVDKHPDIKIESLSGDNFRLEIIYKKV